jgi:hypothetical protein
MTSLCRKLNPDEMRCFPGLKATSHGYILHEVPRLPVQQRAKHVLRTLDPTQREPSVA